MSGPENLNKTKEEDEKKKPNRLATFAVLLSSLANLNQVPNINGKEKPIAGKTGVAELITNNETDTEEIELEKAKHKILEKEAFESLVSDFKYVDETNAYLTEPNLQEILSLYNGSEIELSNKHAKQQRLKEIYQETEKDLIGRFGNDDSKLTESIKSNSYFNELLKKFGYTSTGKGEFILNIDGSLYKLTEDKLPVIFDASLKSIDEIKSKGGQDTRISDDLDDRYSDTSKFHIFKDTIRNEDISERVAIEDVYDTNDNVISNYKPDYDLYSPAEIKGNIESKKAILDENYERLFQVGEKAKKSKDIDLKEVSEIVSDIHNEAKELEMLNKDLNTLTKKRASFDENYGKEIKQGEGLKRDFKIAVSWFLNTYGLLPKEDLGKKAEEESEKLNLNKEEVVFFRLLEEFTERRKFVELIKKEYDTGEKIYEFAFNRKPEGKVTAIFDPTLIHLKCDNADYEKIAPKGSAGVYIPWLKFFTVELNTSDSNTGKHEATHASKNFIETVEPVLLHSISDENIKNFIEYSWQIEDTKKNEQFLRHVARRIIESKDMLIKDEIFAYKNAPDRTNDQIVESLMSDLYDYYDHEKEVVKKTIEEGKDPEAQIELSLEFENILNEERVKIMKKALENYDGFEEMSHPEKGENGTPVGVKRDSIDAMSELYDKPLKNWYSVVNKKVIFETLPTIMSGKKATEAEKIEKLSKIILSELLEEYSKLKTMPTDTTTDSE